MPVNVSNPEDLRGVDVNGAGGEKLGKAEEIYLDNETSKPEWAAVKTGLFGSHVSLVPLAAADWAGGVLTVPFTKDKVKGAPNHDPGREISADDEVELFTYYGIPYGGDTVTATGGPGQGQTGGNDVSGTDAGYTDTTATTGTTGTVGHDTSGPMTDDAMTRSEERVRVGVQRREAGRARLRKYITTETVSQTVPVSREEVVLEREPITEANMGQAMSGGDLTTEEHEVILHADTAVVEKETVPVERIRVGTRDIVEEQTVSAEVRKENIEVETVDDTTGRTNNR